MSVAGFFLLRTFCLGYPAVGMIHGASGVFMRCMIRYGSVSGLSFSLCLVVNGTSTSIIYIYLHGTAARVLTSGHPPGTYKHDVSF